MPQPKLEDYFEYLSGSVSSRLSKADSKASPQIPSQNQQIAKYPKYANQPEISKSPLRIIV